MRVGQGYDLHRLVEGRPLILGGVRIPYNMGLLGHSDADCLIHAIIDALLGAAALGDIGTHFPDTDPQYVGCDSMALLLHTRDLLYDAGYTIGNIDSTIVAQRPKMMPYIADMRRRIADTLGLPAGCVSVKAKTNEGCDAVGTGEAIACYAIACIADASI